MNVPQTRTRSYNVTVYDTVNQQVPESYSVCVPVQSSKTVQVQVCKQVPSTVSVPVYSAPAAVNYDSGTSYDSGYSEGAVIDNGASYNSGVSYDSGYSPRCCHRIGSRSCCRSYGYRRWLHHLWSAVVRFDCESGSIR